MPHHDKEDVHVNQQETMVDGGFVLTYQITNLTGDAFDAVLREWPHSVKADSDGLAYGGYFKRQLPAMDGNAIVSYPADVQFKHVQLKPNQTTQVVLWYDGDLGHIYGHYTQLWEPDGPDDEGDDPPDWFGRGNCFWDDVGLYKSIAIAQSRGPGESSAAQMFIPIIVAFPQVVYNQVGKAWQGAFEMVSIDGVPLDWKPEFLWPRQGVPFALPPFERSRTGLVMLEVPQGVPEGTRVTMKTVQRSIGLPGGREYEFGGTYQLVADYSPPRIDLVDIEKDMRTGTARVSVEVSDDVSGVSAVFLRISTDHGRTWMEKRVWPTPVDAYYRKWKYLCEIGPFPSGREVLVITRALDGVGNEALSPPKALWFSGVVLDLGARPVAASVAPESLGLAPGTAVVAGVKNMSGSRVELPEMGAERPNVAKDVLPSGITGNPGQESDSGS